MAAIRSIDAYEKALWRRLAEREMAAIRSRLPRRPLTLKRLAEREMAAIRSLPPAISYSAHSAVVWRR